MTKPNEPEALEPCPFCGAPAEMTSRGMTEKGHSVEYAVECAERSLHCPASRTAMFHGKREWAIAAWNRRAPAQPVADAVKAERCRRCGHENMSWYAPSPLWNAVMRGGDINGDPIYEDMVCAACFISIASKSGIASDFRVFAKNIHNAVETRTPEGRIWDDKEWLWVDPTAQDWIKSGGEQGSPSTDTIDCRGEGGEKEAEGSTVVQRTVADAGGVTTADREAAATLLRAHGKAANSWAALNGRDDGGLTVQAFARHRLHSVAAATAAKDAAIRARDDHFRNAQRLAEKLVAKDAEIADLKEHNERLHSYVSSQAYASMVPMCRPKGEG